MIIGNADTQLYTEEYLAHTKLPKGSVSVMFLCTWHTALTIKNFIFLWIINYNIEKDIVNTFQIIWCFLINL